MRRQRRRTTDPLEPDLFTAHLHDTGAAASTARSRQLSVRRLSAWLAEEGEIAADPFLGIKSPKLDERVVEPLTDDELRALLTACVPPRGATQPEVLRHRRDEAMIRLMLASGMRAGEFVALQSPTDPRTPALSMSSPRDGVSCHLPTT